MGKIKRVTTYKNIKNDVLVYLEELKKRMVDYRHRGYDFIDIVELENDLDKLAFLLLGENVKIIKRKHDR